LDDLEGADSGSEGDSDDDETPNVNEGYQPARALAFEIDADIDINSRALQDMVSIDPTVVEAASLQFTATAASDASTDLNWDW
jgi:hypothetical protein